VNERLVIYSVLQTGVPGAGLGGGGGVPGGAGQVLPGGGYGGESPTGYTSE